MIFILEGPDGAGKTTLAEHLKETLVTSNIYHATYEKGMDVAGHHFEICTNVIKDQQEGRHSIVDRLYVSEWVYGHVFRGTHYGIGKGLEFDHLLQPFGVIRVMCLPEKKTVLKTFNSRKKEEMFDTVSEIYDEYLKYYMNYGENWYLYDYEKNNVIKLLKETMFDDGELNQYVEDVQDFLDKMGMECLTKPGIHPMIDVRTDHLQEELDELKENVKNKNVEEVIDALVDLVYIAIGTSNLCGFDFDKHWNEVQRANITKERGKTKRGHSFDAMKPKGWKAPNHKKVLNSYK